MRIAVLGSGTIGTALVRAALSSGHRVIGTGRSERTLERVKSLGAEATRNNEEAIASSELVVVSVKPQHFPEMVSSVSSDLWIGRTVVSVMAGVRLETLRRIMRGAEVFRAMPNVNSTVGKSATALAGEGERRGEVDSLFRTVGVTYWVQEELMDVWTALVGSGPAFVSELVDGLVLGAVASGMSRELAYSAVLDMLEGTIANLRAHRGHPLELRDNVTTPAGTTIAGLKVMERRLVKSAMMETVEAASRRAARLGKVIDGGISREISERK